MRKCVMMIAALCVLVINPMVMMSGCMMWGCGSSYDYSYNAVDMARELDAVPRTQRVQLDDGRSVEVSFTIDAASVRDAVQAQARRDFALEFVQTAYACDPAPPGQSIEFTGELVVREISVEGASSIVLEESDARAVYNVGATELDRGSLRWWSSDTTLYGTPTALFQTTTGSGADARLVEVDLGEDSDLNYTSPDVQPISQW